VRLARAGFLKQLLLSHDVNGRTHIHLYGGFGYDYLLAKFVPMLRERGMTEEELHVILVENPRRLLEIPETLV
jgi:phosphotriesterase-related protein